ncbi:MAG: YraN family protein [Bacteroidia bacterium]
MQVEITKSAPFSDQLILVDMCAEISFVYLRSMAESHKAGAQGEEQAAAFLQQAGFQILHRNWRVLHLEVDLVAMKDQKLIIVEVKTRGTDEFGEPETFVSKAKQRNLIRAANFYLEQHHLDHEVRFDVVAIVNRNGQAQIRHIPDAFSPLA